MKKYFGIVFLGCMSLLMLTTSASESVMNIEFNALSLEEAKAEAKSSNKLIFIDCYTVWCGPCKRMAATSFKDPKVGEFYNANFVNLKVEMEKDPDGAEIARKYKVVAYPTLLIIDANGTLLRKVVGMQSSDGLMQFAKAAMAK